MRFAACGRMANVCSSCGANGCVFSSTRPWTEPRRASPSETPAVHADDQPLRLGPVKPGHPASGRAWVHILDGPPGPPARLSATAFTAHDGATVEARAASFEPPMLDSFDLRSSHEVVVTVAVPEGTRPGAYHGHILATGMPEVSLPVRLEVAE